MNIQIRNFDGEIRNIEVDTVVDIINVLSNPDTAKISFDLTDGSRLALYSDGQYQIFGGLVNYPHFLLNER